MRGRQPGTPWALAEWLVVPLLLPELPLRLLASDPLETGGGRAATLLVELHMPIGGQAGTGQAWGL